jgi:hypothetical protein
MEDHGSMTRVPGLLFEFESSVPGLLFEFESSVPGFVAVGVLNQSAVSNVVGP